MPSTEFHKRIRKGQAALLAVAFGLALLGISERAGARLPQDQDDWGAPDSAKKMKNPVAPTPAGLAAAKADYTENCERCHGQSGKGDGYDAKRYDPEPTDFTDAKIMQTMTDGEIHWKISEGRMPMPAFKSILSDQKRWQLVNYLRTFSKPAK